MPGRPPPSLVVTFHKVPGRHPAAWWEAVRPTGGVVRGGHMPIGKGVIPHDLVHLAVEAQLGIDGGFWGLLARGATFRHGTAQRATRPGRALLRAGRDGLEAAEALGNEHHHAWIGGATTPVQPTFDHLAACWRATPDEGTLTVRWPTLEALDPQGASPRKALPCDQPSTVTTRSAKRQRPARRT